MAVGVFVHIDTLGQPEDFLSAEVIFEGLLDLFLGEVGVAAFIEETFFGGQDGAFAIGMNGAPFEDEVAQAIAIDALNGGHFGSDKIVLIPWEVKAIDEAAPSVELPVDGAHTAFAVDDEGGAAVANP